jgi:hypothetical protein
MSYVKSKGRGGHVVWRYLLKRRQGQPESICKPVRFPLIGCSPRSTAFVLLGVTELRTNPQLSSAEPIAATPDQLWPGLWRRRDQRGARRLAQEPAQRGLPRPVKGEISDLLNLI